MKRIDDGESGRRFGRRWPGWAAAAFGAAQAKLDPFLPYDVEDVAIEALEELAEVVTRVKTLDELKSLVASIAHHRAVSRLPEHFAARRGSRPTADGGR